MEERSNFKQPPLWVCITIVLFLVVCFLVQLLAVGEPDVDRKSVV